MENSRSLNNFLSDLMIVMVIYKMEISKSPAYRSLLTSLGLANQQTSLFIYDNSPQSQSYSPVENCRLTYRNDPHNPGVSKAYNEGFQFAKAQDKKWIMLVDQDTTVENDFFLKYAMMVDKNRNEKIFVPVLSDKYGIVSPFQFRFGRGIRLKRISSQQYYLKDIKFINSGLLVACELFERAGGFDEQFQLDFSDLVFIERLRLVTSTFSVVNTNCIHSLSSSERSSLRETLLRFKIYCNAADSFNRKIGNGWVKVWKYLRAIAFSCKYFNWQFINVAFSK